MNAPTAAAAAETSPSVESIVEAEISNLVTQLAKQESPEGGAGAPAPATCRPGSENDAERIRAAVGRPDLEFDQRAQRAHVRDSRSCSSS